MLANWSTGTRQAGRDLTCCSALRRNEVDVHELAMWVSPIAGRHRTKP